LLAVRTEPGDYDVSAQALIALSRGGVGKEIISAIIEVHSKSADHPPSQPASGNPGEPAASTAPAAAAGPDLTGIDGVYLIDGDKRTQLKAHKDVYIKPVFSFGLSGMVRVLSAIPGTRAATRTSNPKPKLEFLIPGQIEPTGLEEVFVADVKSDHREFPAVIKKITVIPGKSRRDFTLVQDMTYKGPLGVKKFDIVLKDDLEPGEYVTSILGLSYDFGVDRRGD